MDALQYSEQMSKRLMQHEYHNLAQDLVGMGIPTGGKVLDVGTGPGYVALHVARLLESSDCQIVGLDLSQAMLAVAAENARQRGLNGTMTWRTGDAKDMPFADGEFDLVVRSGSLHHWEDPLPVLNEIARVFKEKGGCIVRDSKRLQHPGARLFSWAIGLTIPREFRAHYWNSIRSSYTVPELRPILEQSRLRECKIEEDLLDLMVVKEAKGA